MEREQVVRLIERHITAEQERDIAAILATCTPDIGRPFDMEGYGRPIRFRTLRIFEIGGELNRRASVWADLNTIHRQLAPSRHA